jgi:pimeloyl-ACP methyl ester carboxylesterase
MTEPILHFVDCPDGFASPSTSHRMAYWQWGLPEASHVIVCVHGLSRQGRDFDVLARALTLQGRGAVRVVCPDVVGRGKSDWLKNPMAYQIPTYAGDMLTLLTQLQPAKLDWIGTSMGGLIGMVLAGSAGAANAAKPADVAKPAEAATSLPAIRKLVLNDVGPAIQWEALQRIGLYLGNAPRFASLEQAATAMWAVSSSFGPHTKEAWLELSRHMVKPVADAGPDSAGAVTLHYDPAIAFPFRAITKESAMAGEAAVWGLYDAIQSDTLLLRGAQSDLLSKDTAVAMTQRGPKARLLEFDGVGHAPTLIADDQVQATVDFIFS